MAVTLIGDVQDQVQKFWSPLFSKELREQLLLGSLVNKDYQGSITRGGDTVYVSQISAPAGSLRTVGTDADSFVADQLVTSRISIVANKRATAAFEFEDLVDLQSQIGAENSEMRQALLFSVEKQINDHLYSLVSPSTSAPAHDRTGITTMDATELLAIRELAAQAKWMKEKGWYLLPSPQYYSHILGATTLTSSDYVGADAPVIGGQIVNQRFGFKIVEDNSRTGKYAIAFSPDFMHLVMQTQPTFKVADLTAQKKHGYILSCDLIFGAALGINGNVKHIRIAG